MVLASSRDVQRMVSSAAALGRDDHANKRYSNQADLRLLEDIGITPDQTFRESRPSLRAAVLAVMAVRRMQKLSEDWASKKRSQAALMSKLEGMKKTKAKLVN